MKKYLLLLLCSIGFTTKSLTQITYTTKNISSCKSKDGAISIRIKNATPPYKIQWSNGATKTYLDNLEAGDYCVTIEDSGCCKFQECIEIKPPIVVNVAKTNTCGDLGGSITLDVTDNRTPPSSVITYTWKKLINGVWTFYSNEKNIANLAAGKYSALIEYGNCSMVIGYYEIKVGTPIPPSLFSWWGGNTNAAIASGSGSPDCSIPFYTFGSNALKINGNVTGIYGEWFWQNEWGTYTSIGLGFKSPTQKVPSGYYKFVGTNTDGCTTELPIHLWAPDDISVNIETIPNCPNKSDGSIIVDVVTDHAGGYEIAYSGPNLPNTINGITPWFFGKSNILTGVGGGGIGNSTPYYVYVRRKGVTDFCQRAFPVNVKTNNGTSPVIHSKILHPCKGKANGKIELNMAKIGANSTVKWISPASVAQKTNSTLTDLPIGTYTVEVTRCDYKTTASFVLEEVDLQSNLAATNNNQKCITDVVATVYPQLNKPITYNFISNVGGVVQNNVLSAISGSGIVKLQAIDANGCESNKQIEVSKITGIDVQVTQPCVGQNSGVIKITIANPNLEPVIAYQVISSTQKIPIILPALSKTMVVQITDISKSSTNQIEVKIGGCTYLQTFNILPQATKKVYSGYDKEKKLCQYDEVCNGEVSCKACYNENVKVIPRKGWLANAWGGICSGRGECKDFTDPSIIHEVGKVKYPKVTMTLATYELFLANLVGFGIISAEYMGSLLSESSGKPCSLVRVCMQTYLPSGFAGGICTPSFPIEVSPGCFKHKCCGFIKYNFCMKDYVPTNALSENCQPKKYSVKEILLWEQDMISTYPNYQGSTLFKFIQEVKNNPDLLEKANCANVLFCSSDFKLLYSDIKTIDCSPVKNPPVIKDIETPVQPCAEIIDLDNQQKSLFVLCRGKCVNPKEEVGCPEIKKITKSFVKFFQPNAPEEKIVILNEESVAPIFKRFDTVLSEDVITPKAILEDDSLKYICDITDDAIYLKKEKIDNLDYISSDYADNHELYLEKIDEKAFTLEYIDDEIDFSIPFSSSLPIKIIGNIRTADTIILAGVYQKDLLIGENTKLESQTENALFFAKISKTGEIYAINALDGNWDSSSLSFIKTKNNISIVGFNQANSYIFNGQKYDNNTQIITIQPLSQQISKDLVLEGVKLIKSAISRNGNITANIFYGEGNIYQDNKKIATVVNGEVCIVSTDQKGKVIYTKTAKTEQVEPDLLSATFDNSDNLFFATTFSQNISIENTTFVSKGNRDILFSKMANDGTILFSEQYGSVDDENVKEIIFDNNNKIYFGGEIEGKTFNRKIADATLIKMPSIEKAAYVSSFSLSDDSSPTYKNSSGNNINQPNIDFTASPNPVTDILEIVVDCHKDCEYGIVIHDILGRLVWTESGSKGQNLFSVDLSKQNNGLFLITLTSEKGKIVKKIVKQN